MIAGAVCAALVAGGGIVLWRVFRPTDVVTTATRPLPAPVIPAPGALGALISAPLIVGDRIRVHAAPRQVWADGPADFHYETSALWSLRRWPADLVGVVALGEPPVVVSSWSDGMLFGTDADTGRTLWSVHGDTLGDDYQGRRTGAATVYDPPGLFTAGQTVLTSKDKTLTGYDPTTGSVRWRVDLPADDDCRGTAFTAATQFLLHDTCTGTLLRYAADTGAALPPLGTALTAVEPVSCAVGASDCLGVRTTGTDGRHAWLLPPAATSGTETVAGTPTASEPLAAPGAVVAEPAEGATVVVTAPDPAAVTELTGRDPVTGEVRWTWRPQPGDPAPALLPTGARDRVLLVTPEHTLIAVNAETGKELSRSTLDLYYEDPFPYTLGHVYASGNYLVLERLRPDTAPEAPDSTYYPSPRPVLLAAS
ncbi:PQQ-binding-like beta-propeller repeat protein [Catellatospora sp. KI3]|uniref:outer membrane protein assembly factor BamB family protein n=1 Tax=Catellatospora sp. KI3 TaxID=3041620 RepID=UPI0024827BA3|nr:PQQ-binding-like beta-propeller repeat protein [Catellatospora sp. KI3]MDI1466250.1 PQQ-binding-like beta-propeller repeat protein [Catellatospora sp. KI3]